MYNLAPAGKLSLVGRGGSEGTSAVLEVWGQGRLLRELHVPSKQHGPLYNDGWFSLGPAWSPDEARVAYIAEVGVINCFQQSLSARVAQLSPDSNLMHFGRHATNQNQAPIKAE